MPLKWIEVPSATFAKMQSTGQAQPLARENWPEWARTSPAFTGAWFTYIGDLLAPSTETLSTDYARGHLDMERTAEKPPSRRYYRYDYVMMPDNRVFVLGPNKDLEYKRHRNERPNWLASYNARSASLDQ
jgi:hypothetical protein